MESNVINLEMHRLMRLVNCNMSVENPLCVYPAVADMTFASVLNVQSAEILWPGDAAELFFPNLFALRSDDDWLYADNSHIAEHFRCETQRLCNSGYFEGINNYFKYDCDRCILDSAFLATMFGDDGDDAVLFDGPDWLADNGVLFVDDEEDTLNSELLLTQVYEPPKGH